MIFATLRRQHFAPTPILYTPDSRGSSAAQAISSADQIVFVGFKRSAVQRQLLHRNDGVATKRVFGFTYDTTHPIHRKDERFWQRLDLCTDWDTTTVRQCTQFSHPSADQTVLAGFSRTTLPCPVTAQKCVSEHEVPCSLRDTQSTNTWHHHLRQNSIACRLQFYTKRNTIAQVLGQFQQRPNTFCKVQHTTVQ